MTSATPDTTRCTGPRESVAHVAARGLSRGFARARRWARGTACGLLACLGIVAIPRVLAQADGTLKWTFHTQGIVVSSPAIANDGTIYVGSESQRLFALNPNGTAQ
jgi:hypothetical protein